MEHVALKFGNKQGFVASAVNVGDKTPNGVVNAVERVTLPSVVGGKITRVSKFFYTVIPVLTVPDQGPVNVTFGAGDADGGDIPLDFGNIWDIQ